MKKSIALQNFRAWFGFIYDMEKKEFRLAVRKDVVDVDRSSEERLDVPLSVMRRELRIEEEIPFEHNFRETVGFGQAFQKIQETEHFTIYRAEVPKVCKIKGNCPACKGKGKTRDQSVCLVCSGTMKEFDIDWHEASLLAASLSYVFECTSDIVEGDFPDLGALQPYVIRTGVRIGGECVLGEYSPSFAKWIRNDFIQKGGFEVNVTNAMYDLYVYMMRVGNESFLSIDKNHCRASVRNGALVLSAPDCTLCPNWYEMQRDGGYPFFDTGCSDLGQQLTLLAGLGMLGEYYFFEKGLISF